MAGGLLAFHPASHGGLDTGETEIIRVRGTGLALCQAHRHLDGVRVAVLAVAVDVRAARIREAEQAGDLVEALPRRVIQRGTNHVDFARHVFHVQQRGVAAGDDQRQRVLGERAELQLSDGDVPDHMVDAVDRLVRSPGQRLGAGHAHGQATGQSGTGGHGDGVHIRQRHVRVGERLGHAWHEGLGVRTGGDFGDHAAVSRVFLHG